MFFLLSKLFTFILMPYTQMMAWFLLGFFLKNTRWKKNFMILGICYLIFFSNRFIINEVLLLWEVPPTPISKITDKYQVGIVLGGTTNANMVPRDRIYIYKSAERMTHAVQLYKDGIIKKILVTGGSSNIFNTQYKEADQMRRFLLISGIPDTDIIVENQARNTYENAQLSAALINQLFPGTKSLLITSGFHLVRSKKCFDRAGIQNDGFSTDFYGKPRRFTLDFFLIPDPTAFADWHLVIREWLGIIMYKISGYI